MPSSILELCKSDLRFEPDNTPVVSERIIHGSIHLAFPGYPSTSIEIFLNDDVPRDFVSNESASEFGEHISAWDCREQSKIEETIKKKSKSEAVKYSKDSSINDEDKFETDNKIISIKNETQKQIQTSARQLAKFEVDSKLVREFKSRNRRGWSFERGDARRSTRPNVLIEKIRSSSGGHCGNNKSRDQGRTVYTLLKSNPSYLTHESRDRIQVDRRHKDKSAGSPPRMTQSSRAVCKNYQKYKHDEKGNTKDMNDKVYESKDNFETDPQSIVVNYTRENIQQAYVRKDLEIDRNHTFLKNEKCANQNSKLEFLEVSLSQKCANQNSKLEFLEVSLSQKWMGNSESSLHVLDILDGHRAPGEAAARDLKIKVQYGKCQRGLESLPISEKSNNVSVLEECTDATVDNKEEIARGLGVMVHPGKCYQLESVGFKHVAICRPLKGGEFNDVTINNHHQPVEISDLTSDDQPQPDEIRDVNSSDQSQPNEIRDVNSSNQSQPDEIRNINSSNQSQPDEIRDINSSNQSQPDEIKDINSSNQSQPDEIRDINSSNQSQPVEIKDINSSNQSQPDTTGAVTIDNQPQPGWIKTVTISNNQFQSDGINIETVCNQAGQVNINGVKTGNHVRQTEIKDVKTGNHVRQIKINDVKTGNQSGQIKINDVKTGNQSGQIKINDLKTGNQSGQIKINGVKTGNHVRQTEIKDVKTGNQSGQIKINYLKTGNQSGQIKINGVKTGNQSGQIKINDLKTGNQSGQIKINGVKTGNQSGQIKINGVETGNQSGQIKINGVKTGNQSGQIKINDVETGNQSGQIKINGVKTGNQSGQIKINGVETGNQSGQIKINDVKTGNQSGQIKINDVETGNQSGQIKISHLTTSNFPELDWMNPVIFSNQLQIRSIADAIVTSLPELKNGGGAIGRRQLILTAPSNHEISQAVKTRPCSFDDIESWNVSAPSAQSYDCQNMCLYKDTNDDASSCCHIEHDDPNDKCPHGVCNHLGNTCLGISSGICHKYFDKFNDIYLYKESENSVEICCKDSEDPDDICHYKDMDNFDDICHYKGPDSNNCYDSCPVDQDEFPESRKFLEAATAHSLESPGKTVNSEENLISTKQTELDQLQRDSESHWLDVANPLSAKEQQSPFHEPSGNSRKFPGKYETSAMTLQARSSDYFIGAILQDNPPDLQSSLDLKESSNSANGVRCDPVNIEVNSFSNSLRTEADCNLNESLQIHDTKSKHSEISNHQGKYETRQENESVKNKCREHEDTQCQFCDYTSVASTNDSRRGNQVTEDINPSCKEGIKTSVDENDVVSVKSSKLHRTFSENVVIETSSESSNRKTLPTKYSGMLKVGWKTPEGKLDSFDNVAQVKSQKSGKICKTIATSCLEKVQLLKTRSRSLGAILRRIKGFFSNDTRHHRLSRKDRYISGEASTAARDISAGVRTPASVRLETCSKKLSAACDDKVSQLMLNEKEHIPRNDIPQDSRFHQFTSQNYSQRDTANYSASLIGDKLSRVIDDNSALSEYENQSKHDLLFELKHSSQSALEKEESNTNDGDLVFLQLSPYSDHHYRFSSIGESNQLDDFQIDYIYMMGLRSSFLEAITEVDTLTDESEDDELDDDVDDVQVMDDVNFEEVVTDAALVLERVNETSVVLVSSVREADQMNERNPSLQISSSCRACSKDADESSPMYKDIVLMCPIKTQSLINVVDIAREDSRSLKVICPEVKIKRYPSFHNLSNLRDNNSSTPILPNSELDGQDSQDEPSSELNLEAIETSDALHPFKTSYMDHHRVEHLNDDLNLLKSSTIDSPSGQNQRLFETKEAIFTETEISNNENEQNNSSNHTENKKLKSRLNCTSFESISPKTRNYKGYKNVNSAPALDLCNSCLSDIESDSPTIEHRQNSSQDQIIQSSISNSTSNVFFNSESTETRPIINITNCPNIKSENINSETASGESSTTSPKNKVINYTNSKYECMNSESPTRETITSGISKNKIKYMNASYRTSRSVTAISNNKNSLVRNLKYGRLKSKPVNPNNKSSLFNSVDSSLQTPKSATEISDKKDILFSYTDTTFEAVNSKIPQPNNKSNVVNSAGTKFTAVKSQIVTPKEKDVNCVDTKFAIKSKTLKCSNKSSLLNCADIKPGTMTKALTANRKVSLINCTDAKFGKITYKTLKSKDKNGLVNSSVTKLKTDKHKTHKPIENRSFINSKDTRFGIFKSKGLMSNEKNSLVNCAGTKFKTVKSRTIKPNNTRSYINCTGTKFRAVTSETTIIKIRNTEKSNSLTTGCIDSTCDIQGDSSKTNNSFASAKITKKRCSLSSLQDTESASLNPKSCKIHDQLTVSLVSMIVGATNLDPKETGTSFEDISAKYTSGGSGWVTKSTVKTTDIGDLDFPSSEINNTDADNVVPETMGVECYNKRHDIISKKPNTAIKDNNIQDFQPIVDERSNSVAQDNNIQDFQPIVDERSNSVAQDNNIQDFQPIVDERSNSVAQNNNIQDFQPIVDERSNSVAQDNNIQDFQPRLNKESNSCFENRSQHELQPITDTKSSFFTKRSSLRVTHHRNAEKLNSIIRGGTAYDLQPGIYRKSISSNTGSGVHEPHSHSHEQSISLRTSYLFQIKSGNVDKSNSFVHSSRVYEFPRKCDEKSNSFIQDTNVHEFQPKFDEKSNSFIQDTNVHEFQPKLDGQPNSFVQDTNVHEFQPKFDEKSKSFIQDTNVHEFQPKFDGQPNSFIQDTNVHEFQPKFDGQPNSFVQDTNVHEFQPKFDGQPNSFVQDTNVHEFQPKFDGQSNSFIKSSNESELKPTTEMAEPSSKDSKLPVSGEAVMPVYESGSICVNETSHNVAADTVCPVNKDSAACLNKQTPNGRDSMAELSHSELPTNLSDESLLHESYNSRSHWSNQSSIRIRLAQRMQRYNESSHKLHDLISRSHRHLEKCDKLIIRSAYIIARSREMALYCRRQMENTAQMMNLKSVDFSST